MAEDLKDVLDENTYRASDARSDESFVAVEESNDFIKGVGRVLAISTLASVLTLILVMMVFDNLMLLVLFSAIFILLALAFNAWLILGRWDARLMHIELLNQRFMKEIDWIQERLPKE